MRRILLACLLLMSVTVFADQVTVSWTLPNSYCNQTVIQAGEITQMEIYVSTSTISASDVPCGGVADTPPPGGTATVVTPDPNLQQVDIDLAPGVTYFLRARVQVVTGEWSNFSSETQRFVPFPRPDVPTITIINLN